MQKSTISSATFADTKPHFELLDGLRGVAAILVLFYHIFEGFSFAELTNGAGDGVIRTLNHGHIAVDFFFILSGFVISYAYDDRWNSMNTRQFFKRRLIRLHPMLIMGAIIGTIAFAVVGFERWDGTTAPTGWVMTALLLTMFMIPAVPGVPYEVRGNGEMFPLNGPGWSLFFEYIGNILYALFIRRLSTVMLALLTVILGAVHAWFFIWNISGYDMIGVGWTLDAPNFFGGFIRMMFPFTLGMLISRNFKPCRAIKGIFWIAAAALFAIFSVPYIPACGEICTNGIYELVCIALFFPIILWLGASGSASADADSGNAVSATTTTDKVSNFLGELSYPLYIVHYPVMYLFYQWLIANKIYTLGECWPVVIGIMLYK